MLKELGYDGRRPHVAGQRRRAAQDARRRRAEAVPDHHDGGHRARQSRPTIRSFKEVLPLLKGRGVQFVLLMNGLKPSDPAGDARAVEIIREMSALARDSGAQLLLYPH